MKNLLATVTATLLLLFGTAAFNVNSVMAANPIYIIKTSLGNIEVELFSAQAPVTVKNFTALAEGKKAFTEPGKAEKVKRPFYDGLVFHRVIKDFMIQGGCPLGTGTGDPGYRFKDEIDADALGLDQLKAFDPEKGPHPYIGRSQREFQRNVLMPLFRSMNIKSQAELDSRKQEVDSRVATLTVKEVYENQGYHYSTQGSGYAPLRGSVAMANSGPDTNGSQFFINLVDTPWLAGKHTVFGKVVAGIDVVDKIGQVPVKGQGKPAQDVTIISIRAKQP